MLYAMRRHRLRAKCVTVESEALLITAPPNVRYLSGCSLPGSVLLLTAHRDVLVRPIPSADSPCRSTPDPPETQAMTVVSCGTGKALVTAVQTAEDCNSASLRVEERHLSVSDHRLIRATAPGLHLIGLETTVEDFRRVKDEQEIGNLRKAAAVAGEVLREFMGTWVLGRSEAHLSLELEHRVADQGATGAEFRASAGSGPHSGGMDHTPTRRRVRTGDFLSIRLGVIRGGYHCEVARTFVIGADPQPWQIDTYGTAFQAQRSIREHLRTGAAFLAPPRGEESSPVCTVHGLGLEPREEPHFDAQGTVDPCTAVVAACSFRRTGLGGVLIGDTLITSPKAGRPPELLTTTPKDLIRLP
ncbi:M24 family metallopeptidase [Streptomyces sp. NPDC021100]|uniref:M24 family metallopeptidase n=1 Tax=Streptomyces sp. NPDC021100 TaxID=3365114 RepID=UPI0037B0C51D